MGYAVFDEKFARIKSSTDHSSQIHARHIRLLVGLVVARLPFLIQTEGNTELVQQAKVGPITCQGKYPIVGQANFSFWSR